MTAEGEAGTRDRGRVQSPAGSVRPKQDFGGQEQLGIAPWATTTP